MKDITSVRQFLITRFQEIRSKNPNFSVRAFSQRLGTYPSALNEIMKGERGLSYKKALKMAEMLSLTPAEKSEFLSSYSASLTANNDEIKPQTLAHNQFEYISDWIHFAILSLIKTPDFKSDSKWIASRLGISPKKASQALKRLFDLGLLDVNEDRELERTQAKLTTPRDILNVSMQKSHLDDLELIRENIHLDVKLRDYCSYTLPVDPKLLDRAKDIIREAQDKIDVLMSSGCATEVYRINSYMYPLTKINKAPNYEIH